MATGKIKRGEIYIANESFTTEIDGNPITVTRGITRVRGGHELLKGREQFFDPIDVHYEVEDASAEPGRKRGKTDDGS